MPTIEVRWPTRGIVLDLSTKITLAISITSLNVRVQL